MKNSSQQSEVNAHEVLSFPHAELQKNQDGKNKISSVGILSVLYFPDYNRYILYLDDWSYALLRRLPVVVSSHTSHDSRCYTFPAYTGDYIVKLNKISHPEGVQNFETILKNNSQFSYEGEEPRQRETSPSDKFNEFEEHGDSYKEKGVTETGKLKTKEKVKRGFKKIKSKFTSHYSADQKCNLNLKQVKDYDQLKNSGVDPSHSHHKLGRKDVEAIIVRSKDIARARGYFIENPIQRQGKQEMQNSYEIKETIVKIPEEETYKLRAAQLIDEIENERRLQEIERRNQDSHRQMELFHVERERELQNSIRAQQQEKSTRQIEQMQQMERSLLSEVQRKEAILLEQEKLRREEALAFSKKEKQLQEELDFKFAQLLQKEEITEAERAELAAQIMRLRESEFLVLSQSQKQRNEEAERRQKELREKEIEIKMKEMQFENLCQQEAELLAQNEKLLQGHQKTDQEPWYMDQALLQKDSEFETYSKSQNICQVTTSVERSQHKLGEIDLINRP